MSKRVVELNSTESTVFSVVKKYQPISSNLIAHYTELNINDIENALEKLMYQRLIVLGAGGSPKRYRIVEIVGNPEANEYSNDRDYEKQDDQLELSA